MEEAIVVLIVLLVAGVPEKRESKDEDFVVDVCLVDVVDY